MASARKANVKPPKSRPTATAAISQPAVQDSSNSAALSAFNDAGTLFAFLSLAVDKHRLRVYDTCNGQSIAEYVFDTAGVTSLIWAQLVDTDRTDESPSKRKRRKKADDQSTEKATTEAMLLGMSDGTVTIFSPSHGRVARVLSDAKSTMDVLAIAVHQDTTLWTSSADSTIRQWDLVSGNVLGSFKSDHRIPYSSLTLRPSSDEDVPQILAAHHSIHLLSFDKNTSTLASFSGHASPVKILQWDASQVPPNHFISMAQGDRVVSVWEIPREGLKDGKLVASVQLDSDARVVALRNSDSGFGTQTLLALSASGRITLYPIPSELGPPTKSQQKVSSLLPRSTIVVPPSKNTSGAQLLSAAFATTKGAIQIARVIGGVKPVFDSVSYLQDGKDAFRSEVILEDVSGRLETESGSNIFPNTRYTEVNSVAVGSGAERGHAPELDDFVGQDGELDADLAELSLGQRLTVLTGAEKDDASDEEADGTAKSEKKGKGQNDIAVVPAASLTRTLIQALHSSDSRLLETCLAHSDGNLIRNTIKALPPQLSVPLLMACTDRLSRGARAANMKGGGGGASSQRGASLIVWVKTVLTIHSGHLMTMPDLVARLSGLHTTVTSRLALQESLLLLSGRLDMVLSQIEMRSSSVPANLVVKKSKPKEKSVKKYVEGESEDDDAKMDVEVEVGSDDEGSVEDVELGGQSSSAEDEDEDGNSDDDEDDEDEDEEGDSDEGVANGFIDDEADEYSDEESGESE